MSTTGGKRTLAVHPGSRYGSGMAVDASQLRELVRAEIALIEDEAVRTRIGALLLEPSVVECRWDYWEWDKERFEETYPCWPVLADTWPSGRRVAIVYCENGFGPLSPWGLVFLDEEKPSMGQDCGWFPTFREAVADLLDIPAERLML